MKLSLKLRSDGIIKTAGPPFAAARIKEFKGLIARDVLNIKPYDPDTMDGYRLYKSRCVNEIKGKGTAEPFEKVRVVIQAYNDEDKRHVLTQAPTLQRSSQRILLCLAPSLQDCDVYLRDIIQAYCQAKDPLARFIIAELPDEMKSQYPPGYIMHIKKSLYGIPEAGAYWFKTYHEFHHNKLGMESSTFDACLMVTSGDPFAMVGLQTDDSLMIATKAFIEKEQAALTDSQLDAKPVEKLTTESPIFFNGGRCYEA